MPRKGASRKTSKAPTQNVFKINVVKFPVTDKDDETVVCKMCGLQCTYREFRIHNLEKHYNISTTVNDETKRDHKFYARQLNELAKVTKTTTFKCPTVDCKSFYKSTLGLAHHLLTCGKTEEEILECMLECEICHQKFPPTHLNMHKKTHAEIIPSVPPPISISTSPSAKRKSAIKALKVLQQVKEEAEEGDENQSKPEFGKRGKRKSDDPNFIVSETPTEDQNAEVIINEDTVNRTTYPWENETEFTIPILNNFTRIGEVYTGLPPCPSLSNPFEDFKLNKMIDCVQHVDSYLPNSKLSVEFKSAYWNEKDDWDTLSKSLVCHRLSWFSSENVVNSSEHVVCYTGGSISALAWHPDNKHLAVSCLHDNSEIIYLNKTRTRKCCVEIYELLQPINSCQFLNIELIIGFDCGYINHLQWGNIYNEEDELFGFLAMACEDSTVRICGISRRDCHFPPNFQYREDSKEKIRVYSKTPEICLKIHESTALDTGQCIKMDWHETNKFLIAAYCSGHAAVYDLQTKCELYFEYVEDGKDRIKLIYPFWTFKAHVQPINGLHFDPTNPRYIFTGSRDHYLKMWDMETKLEVECKKIGQIIDTCWVRGWIHVLASSDVATSNVGSVCNFTRFYQLGNPQGRPNCSSFFNAMSVDCNQGLSAQGTEDGLLTATFYDEYWRDSDYERNKKKKNVVHLSRLELDPESYEPITLDNFCSTGLLHDNHPEPRLILKFIKERLKSLQYPDPDANYFEAVGRFNDYIRINKVQWNPIGKYLAVGYKNGLLAICPASFEDIFQ